MRDKLIERLIRYTKINTRSDQNSNTIPSTDIQFDLARVLLEELKQIGVNNVRMSDVGIVYATLPANTDKDIPAFGLIAHMDTADFNSENVNPRVIENYNGEDIVLNEALNIITKVEDFPNLKNHKGKTLIVTDGLTLLGADNKAGIANIMTAIEYLIEHPEIEHGTIQIAFTIDEEIGTGANSFDVENFGAKFAYTVDGGAAGEMEFETFNAAAATVSFKGVSVHPGTAKDTMINANLMAHDFISQLPRAETPENTEKYQGFYLVTDSYGTIEDAAVTLIIRDHDREEFEAKKTYIKDVVAQMNGKYGQKRVTLDMQDSYYNMREVLEDHMEVVELAQNAIKAIGLTPIIEPVRGGTDGSRLS
ncbi:MAG TPA: peptidase T, partial [Erysipelothrix sp.]|nr:peptidase T [Erysipelothrix sp.]